VASDAAGDDEETITADPTNSNYVYAVWDSNNGAAIFARTSDGGITWSHPKTIYSATGCCDQIVVLPNGTLVDIFSYYSAVSGSSYVETLQSTDHCDTWAGPFIVSINESIGVVDARTQAQIRTGNGIPSTAVDPRSGAIYIVWQDSRFSGNQRDGVALSKSINGGVSWSNPVQVNQVPQVQAFNPTIAVSPDGAVAITYFDFRQAGTDGNSLETSYWQIVSTDGGVKWRETPVAGAFDMLRAARSGTGYFIGDYQALVAVGDGFVPFFAATNSGLAGIGSSIFALPRERRGSLAWNGRTEINQHPSPFRARRKPKGKRKP
jgi:hypothetical protein